MTDTVRTPMNLTDISKIASPSAITSTGGSCGCCAPRQGTAPQTATEGTVSTEYSVSGLTCGACAGRVTSALRTVDGVQDVRITLVPGGTSTVSVTSNQPIPKASVQDAVEKAGYQLTTA